MTMGSGKEEQSSAIPQQTVNPDGSILTTLSAERDSLIEIIKAMSWIGICNHCLDKNAEVFKKFDELMDSHKERFGKV